MRLATAHLILLAFFVVQINESHAEPAVVPVVVHVAPDGDDAAHGSRDDPLRTLERARDAVRGARADGATVWLHPGVYRLTETLVLDARDSGREEAPVVFRAIEPGTARIIGGRQVPTSEVKPVTDTARLARLIDPSAQPRLRQIDLRRLGIGHYGAVGPRGFRRPYLPAPLELFVNGRPLTLARWPNRDEPPAPMGRVSDVGSVPRDGDFSNRGGAFAFDGSRPRLWAEATDVHLSGHFAAGFADDTVAVTAIDRRTGVLTLSEPHLYGFQNRSYATFHALNLFEEIDEPGEYFVDRETGVLYFLPPEDFSDDAELFVSEMEDPLVALEGASHVRFESLVFEITRGSAVSVEGGHGVILAHCTFRNLGVLAVQFGKGASPLPCGFHDGHGGRADGVPPPHPIARQPGSWQELLYVETAWNRESGSNHRVMGCEIHDTGAGGILLGGGDRATLTPGGNEVVNCRFRRVNRWERTYRPAVSLDGVGNRVTHSEFEDLTGSAILIHGNDHIIEFNRFERVVRESSDMGAIYLGRDPSAAGTIIRHNAFFDITHPHPGNYGAHAVFIDDSGLVEELSGNLFARIGDSPAVFFNAGTARRIEGNVFLLCAETMSGLGPTLAEQVRFMRTPFGEERVRRRVDVTAPPYSVRYPWLAALYADASVQKPVLARNLVVSEPDITASTRTDRTFIDGDQTVTLPLSRMGLMLNAFRPAWPVPPPRFEERLPLFVGHAEIVIEAGEPDGQVVYTLDGSDPGAGSPVYTAPIRVTGPTCVRARTLRKGVAPELSEAVQRRFRPLRAHPVTAARINFQPDDAAPPTGWLADTGAVFRDEPGQPAFGWLRPAGSLTRRRQLPPTEASRSPAEPPPVSAATEWTAGDGDVDEAIQAVRASLIHLADGNAWQIAVEPGRYRVRLIIGDPAFPSFGQSIRVGGVWFCRGLSLDRGAFRELTDEVEVPDGILTLVCEPFQRPRQMRINGIDIRRVGDSSAGEGFSE